VRRLDGEVLRETMCRLLREGDESAYLVFELLVEGMDPAWVAAERGVSALMLTELLCDAVDALAVEYEDVANQAWTHAAHQGCDRCHHASAAHKRAAGAWRGAR
jgi:hypothetical protein